MNEEEKAFKDSYHAVLDAAVRECIWGDGTKRGVLLISNSETQSINIYAIDSTTEQVRRLLVGSLDMMILDDVPINKMAMH